eukprot:TRINITY_DN3681_c2_g1_i8.p1 TRINITY_DN3681_c2_g1~~TRINITY_DN3681_c2_g1_i8.p1  ORF type:complete len:218 (-),score=74.88 TRINITY_DN3681_c2_g1_i8:1438-2091(-)
MILVHAIRIIIRDAGLLERWVEKTCQCFPNLIREMGDRLDGRDRSEWLLAKRVLYNRKYLFFSTQRGVDEVNASLIIIILLLMDQHVAPQCLITCLLGGQDIVWLLVIEFTVLAIVTLMSRKVVREITKRRLHKLELDIDMFVEEFGQLNPDSPLIMFSDVLQDDQLNLPLMEQSNIVCDLHLRKYELIIIVSSLLAAFLGLTCAGQIVYYDGQLGT